MHIVHLENVVSGSKNHLVALGEYHSLQHVDHLRNIAHSYAVSVFVENIESGACE